MALPVMGGWIVVYLLMSSLFTLFLGSRLSLFLSPSSMLNFLFLSTHYIHLSSSFNPSFIANRHTLLFT